MNVNGEGAPKVGEVLRQMGGEALLRELEAAGLGVHSKRCRCPFDCVGDGPTRGKDVQVYTDGKPHVHCFKCHRGGDLVDVLQVTRTWTKEQAIAHVLGQPVSASRTPPLQLVRTAKPPPEPGQYLDPKDVQQIWKSLAEDDEEGRAYLESRRLDDAIGLGLVRFAQKTTREKRITWQVKHDYRLAMLASDVVGIPRGIQLRLPRELRPGEKLNGEKKKKHLGVKGSNTGIAFFGRPDLIEGAPIICVTEGMADTLALSVWTANAPGVVVVGAPGTGSLPALARELEAAGIPITDKLFLLWTQRDDTTKEANKSRKAFEHLRQLLISRSAKAVHINVPDPEFKDVAAWLRANPDVEWPPPDVVKAFPIEEVGAEDRPQLADGCAVPIPRVVESDRFEQDFTTLCALLDDAGHRQSITGPGSLSYCEMTGAVRLGARPLTEVDLSAIRLGLESHKTIQGKPLKFGVEDIARALDLLSRRKTVHPVRDWLKSLKWDREPRLDIELPSALGHGESSLVSVLLSKWMISAVARALKPGCKVDTVLVLVGPQGVGKSSFFSALGGEWFTDSPVNIADKDGKMVMRRNWIIEWAELDAMRRANDQEAIKAFLSARVDQFRKPYGRDVVEVPRGCVIVGTTNNREFLQDPTGNRRFWPIEVNQLKLEWVQKHRDQLFAEAVARYEAGERWWLTPDEEQRLAETHEEHKSQHPWAELVCDWLDASAFTRVTATQVLIEGLKKPQHQLTKGDEKEVGKLMRELGWKKARERVSSSTRWVYSRP